VSFRCSPLVTVNTISSSSESIEKLSQVSHFPQREQIHITPEWVEGYTEGFQLASGLFKVGQQSGRSESNENNLSLEAQILELKQQLQDKTDSLTLYRQAVERASELNISLTRQLDQTHTNVDHLTESYIDVLARNSFLEDRNQYYYHNYHGLHQETQITGPLIDTEDKPPTQGPF
jgi:hypothetical protein